MEQKNAGIAGAMEALTAYEGMGLTQWLKDLRVSSFFRCGDNEKQEDKTEPQSIRMAHSKHCLAPLE